MTLNMRLMRQTKRQRPSNGASQAYQQKKYMQGRCRQQAVTRSRNLMQKTQSFLQGHDNQVTNTHGRLFFRANLGKNGLYLFGVCRSIFDDNINNGEFQKVGTTLPIEKGLVI